MQANSEDRIQAEMVRWYTNTYCLVHHEPRCLIMSVPNGGTRDGREAMTMKSTGLLAGASDLIVIHGYGLLIWVETKTSTGRQSPAQKDFKARIKALGYTYVLARSLTDFQSYILTLPLNKQPRHIIGV